MKKDSSTEELRKAARRVFWAAKQQDAAVEAAYQRGLKEGRTWRNSSVDKVVEACQNLINESGNQQSQNLIVALEILTEVYHLYGHGSCETHEDALLQAFSKEADIRVNYGFANGQEISSDGRHASPDAIKSILFRIMCNDKEDLDIRLLASEYCINLDFLDDIYESFSTSCIEKLDDFVRDCLSTYCASDECDKLQLLRGRKALLQSTKRNHA